MESAAFRCQDLSERRLAQRCYPIQSKPPSGMLPGHDVFDSDVTLLSLNGETPHGKGTRCH